MTLHTELQNFVTTYGRNMLVSPYIGGMLEDALLFRSPDARPYRALFRTLVQENVLSQISTAASWSDDLANRLTRQVEQLYHGKANIAYALEAVAYSCNLISEITAVSDSEAIRRRIDTQEYSIGQRTIKYIPHGSNKCIGTEIPLGMAQAVHRHLHDIENEEGSVIDMVAHEMGETASMIEDKISGEQIDGVAMAIRQMRNGRGFILGDMTGIGKGRQLAMLIKWATLQGTMPVVVTEKSVLFSDLYRDLYDVGYASLRPFILNSDREARIFDQQGNVMYNLPSEHEMSDFLTNGTLPAGYDLLMLTYSQMSRASASNPKAQAMLNCVKGSYLIMDECHNATGTDSNIGIIFRQAVQNCAGVCFSSATYAKYPASMPIYALKTAIGEANIKSEQLIDIITKGGPILQEVMAKGLVESGSMIRRQRDMSGIENRLYSCQDKAQIDHVREQYDGLVGLISDLRDFQDQFIKVYLADRDVEALFRSRYKLRANTVPEQCKIVYAKFSTRITPTIRQLLFSIKAKDAVDVTIRELRAGRKPIVQIARTMESTVKRLIENGESFARADFALVLLMCLQGMFSFKVQGTIKTGTRGKMTSTTLSENFEFTLDDLEKFFGNSTVRQAYDSLENKIRNYDSGLPLSPVDYYVESLEDAGYRVGELTQRSLKLHYLNSVAQANGSAIAMKRTYKNKKETADRFNNGAIDVLVGNRVMASGISLHSSPLFGDTRQRVIITWEAQDRADLQTQFNGRADRTGQLQHCAFITISSPIPAEQRFLMMNNRKQMSLNANVEGSQETDCPIIDILNKYGAQVAQEFLKENPEFNDLIEIHENMLFGSKKSPSKELMTSSQAINYISEFMRSLCLAECCDQENIMEDIFSRYTELIRTLDDAGENDLQTAPRKLNATLIQRNVFCKGLPYSTSVFGADANLEELEVDVLRTPLTGQQIEQMQGKLLSPAQVTALVERYKDSRIRKICDYYNGLKANANARLGAMMSSGGYTPSRLKQLQQRANNTENMNRQIDAVKTWTRDMATLASRFIPGQAVGIPVVLKVDVLCEDPLDIDSCVSQGIFLGYRISGSACTPSNIKAVFAVNDSRRIITIPLSKEGQLDCIYNQTHLGIMIDRLKDVNVKTWDGLRIRNARERAYIITGNIILGIARARNIRMDVTDVKARELIGGMCSGMLINFTDDRGRIRYGYHLPHSFNPQYIRRYVNA